MKWRTEGVTPRTGKRSARRRTANDLLKSRWRAWTWSGMVLAVLIHGGLFAFWPSADVTPPPRGGPPEIIRITVVPDVTPPEPPGDLPQPAIPLVELPVPPLPEDLAVDLPRLDALLELELPPPPQAAVDDALWTTFRRFIPSMVRPEIVNRAEVVQFLRRRYQPILNATGASGRVGIRLWIDSEGRVRHAEVTSSSGSRRLDDLVMHLADVLEFRPAVQGGTPVAVHVLMPITFLEVRRGASRP